MLVTQWLSDLIDYLAQQAPPGSFLSMSFNIQALLAVILVSIICGTVGSLVVGNRMAFFSDALAHCAFAGVALGMLLGVMTQANPEGAFYQWLEPLIMISFGAVIGLAIAFVREQTSLASDTVIGVFFAGAIGFGAMLFKALSRRGYFDPEGFLFGNPLSVNVVDLIVLMGLVLVTVGLLYWMYNYYVFASFNPSLGRARRIPVRLCNYLFIILLALIVNLCLRIVGALLINAMLIVPAATASNLCLNMRQLFWTTILLSLSVGVLGTWLSFAVRIPLGPGEPLTFGIGGTIVVLSVILFFLSMIVGPLLRGRQA